MKDVFTNRRNDYQQNNNDDQNLYNNNGGQENKPKSPGKVSLRTVQGRTRSYVQCSYYKYSCHISVRGDEDNKKY